MSAASIRRARDVHRRAMLVVSAVAVLVGLALPWPGIELQLALVVAGVALLGLPHGAFDDTLAQAAWGLGARGRVAFAAAYLALAGAVVGAWALAPTLSLAVFLAVSVVHFGAGDAEAPPGAPRALETAVRGALPLVLPIAFHPEAVAAPFAWLTGRPAPEIAQALAAFAPWGLGAWCAAAAVHLTRSRRDRLADLELGVLAAACAALPPLLSFGLYFCGWHSARHLLVVDARVRARRRALVLRAAGVLLATLALFAAGHAWSAGRAIDAPAAARTLFVGLAALTLPHMIVTALAARAPRARAAGNAA